MSGTEQDLAARSDDDNDETDDERPGLLTKEPGSSSDVKRDQEGESDNDEDTSDRQESGAGSPGGDQESDQDVKSTKKTSGSDKEDDDDEDDEDEDEDEDEEDEEDEDDEMTNKGRRKRPKRDRRNQFLDIEAEVEDEEEEVEEDEDDLVREDGFIQDVETEGDLRDERLHREMDRQRDAMAEADAERIASELRERYGRSTASKYRGESAIVPQRLLLPSVNDPSIWGVRCKPGKEKELVRLLMKKKENLQYSGHPLEIFSAFQRDSFVGYLYIEARKKTAVEQALKGMVNVYPSRLILVPVKEYVDLLRVNKSNETELLPGAYVRIKRGKYQGDLAIVENLSENGLEARLKIVPRLDYGRNIDPNNPENAKRKRAVNNKTRPPQRLFSEQEALKHDARSLQKRGPSSFLYGGEDYENGFLIKDYKINLLETNNIKPRLEEVTRFNSNDEGIDLHALAQSIKQTEASEVFQPGDQVEVYSGEQTGITGRVVSVDRDIVTLRTESAGLAGKNIEVPSGNLRKMFKQGDHVKVITGRHKDDTGMIVKIAEDKVSLLSDLSSTEITVLSKDLQEASESSGAPNLGQFELHDLVQLSSNMVGCIVKVERESVRILDQNGRPSTILPSSIVRKIDEKLTYATDRNGAEVRVGDTVKEVEGEGRSGTILHIHRTRLFILSRTTFENAGVFVLPSGSVATVAAKGGRIQSSAPDLNRLNPNLQLNNNPTESMGPPQVRQGGRDRALGYYVRVSSGPHKGLLGRVKDTTDVIARVELHTKNKIISVKKDFLRYQDPHNPQRFMTYQELITPRRALAGVPSMPQYEGPSGGGATPAWGMSGGKTPAWAGGGSKTPAWGGSSDGGKTPAWNSGSRTPAWNSGSKTPAWNAGSRTPAWNAGGGRTPAWNAGSRTPAYGSEGSTRSAWETGPRTPASYDSVGKTPGRSWGESDSSGGWGADSSSYGRTPGGYTDVSTPAAYTPYAVSAATPGAAPTPGPVSAATPGPAAAPTPGTSSWGEAYTPAASGQTPGPSSDKNDDYDGDYPTYAPPSP